MRQANEIVQLAVHPALLPALVEWLDARRLDMVPGPQAEDELPTYITSLRDEDRGR